MIYVIDCSFSSALFLPDEKSQLVSEFFLNTITTEDSLYVPHLWHYETNNVINTAIRRKRLTIDNANEVIALLAELKVQTDSACGLSYSKELVHLSQQHELSAYDAAYLELALRKKARLMTLDKKLNEAFLSHD